MYREKIDAYIDGHKQEMLDDICELCRINSEKMPYEEGMPFGPGAAECLDAALDMAEGYGFEVQDYDGFVGTIDLNEKENQLDILAHLDVVPAGDGWKVTEPFKPLIRDGKIYGRGTADDKGPAVAALYAMRAVKELGIPLKKNVRLILGTDEECGGSDIAHYYRVEKEAPMTFSPDGDFPVVNIEKGRFSASFTKAWPASEALPRVTAINAGTKINVVPGKAVAVVEGVKKEELEAAAKAVEAETGVRFEIVYRDPGITITAIGQGAHASLPEEGNNAITGLLTLLTSLPLAECPQVETMRALLTLMPHGDVHGVGLGINMQDELSGALTLAFSMLTMTAESFEGQFDSRCPICANEDNVMKAVNEKMAAFGISQNTDRMIAPHHVNGNSPFVKTLLRVYEDYTGNKGECIALGGGTYVHNLKNGVAFGCSMPGTDNRMHGADEFAVIDELVVSAKMFAGVIVELCQ